MPVLSAARQAALPPKGDQQVQRPFRAAIRDHHFQVLLTSAKRAEIWYRPIQISQIQQAFNEANHLPKRQPKQHLQPLSVIVAQ